MQELNESVDGILERGRETRVVAAALAADYGWVWPEFDAAAFAARLAAADGQAEELALAAALARAAAGALDFAVAALLEDLTLGLQLARLRFKRDPARARLFAGLRLNNTGRESRQQQALEFECAWRKAEPEWVFKEGVTLAVFRARRLALQDLEEALMAASKEETFARGTLQESAGWLHEQSVDWYEAATASWGSQSVPGALVRTLPTTYDPNRPPGPLVFTRAESPAAGAVSLRWRAPRGAEYVIWALAPGALAWVRLLDGVTENSWSGEKLEAGTWRFKGRAENKFGEGTESETVPVPVAAVEAA